MKEDKNNKMLKSLFVTYFDGCHGVYAEPNTTNTFDMGVCKLEYKDNELTVHLRRPGLLIGEGRRTIAVTGKRKTLKGYILTNFKTFILP